MTKKVNFYQLYRKFKDKVIKHFLVTTICTILSSFILAIINNIIFEKLTGKNFKIFLPEKLQKYFPDLTKNQFIFFGLLLTFIFAISHYFSGLQEEELRIKGNHYIKNRLLDKFRQLPFQEKQAKSKEINTLVEIDANEIGHTWEHLPNHIYHSIFTIFLLLFLEWEKFKKMSLKESIFAFFWLSLISVIGYWFTRLVINNGKKYKKELAKESALINKENEKIILIESMGLTSHYRLKQRTISRKNENLLLFFNHIKLLNKTIPNYWLAESFPYLLLLVGGSFSIVQASLLPLWWIFENFRGILQCFWEYTDYASSLERINSFLSLSEKNDNSFGKKISKKLKIINVHFQNITFFYDNESKPILKNYNRVFSLGEINYLIGENGAGKSTIIYLLLGMILPQEGQVILEDEKGQKYNLHQDINLKYWRENNISYSSYDNLINQGSTGQKQWENFQQILKERKDSQIFCFDEADNALDKDKQKDFQKQLSNLVKKEKLIIYINHQ